MLFSKVLIANRGEIAVRLIRACREMGIATVAVYSEADASSPHVAAADEAVCIGPAASRESYLSVDRLLSAARQTGAAAIHPGYGFLAENAAFAQAVIDAGLTFIGPSPEAIAAMGDKTAARIRVSAAGVPVAPANEDPPSDPAALAAAAAAVGYPLLAKAAAGGGGKGMRIVRRPEDLADAFATAQREATSAFGDGRVFLERYIDQPRHIEVQILADAHGNIIHLGERECSVQRRHQKIIEETPSPAVTPKLRKRLTDAAIAAARSVGYVNAGTIEFLLDRSGEFYFLEMNTRLQVEHPVTELVTGVDLVQAQLRIAAGEPLWLKQEDIRPRGHAIECRVCAEDPENRFLPSPGKILALSEPHGPGLRVDSGIAAGLEVSPFYDPMLAKVCAWAETREAASRRLAAALADYSAVGCTTNVAFARAVLVHPAFLAGDTHTHFIDEHLADWRHSDEEVEAAAAIAAVLAMSSRPAQVATADRATSATPWASLGHWRLGEGGGR